MTILTTFLEKAAILEALDKSLAIIEFKPDGTIVSANRSFLDAMGYAIEEVRGKHHSLFCEQNYANSADYRKFWEELRQGRFQSAQFKRLGKGGKELWIVLSSISDL